MELKEGADIVVIGGGPAGSFFAIYILDLAKKLGREINVTIFDKKDFFDIGPKGCNMCAGIIQDSVISSLRDMGVSISQDVIQRKIDGYAFHLKGLSAYIKKGHENNIYSLFRGSGPSYLDSQHKESSFDQYLLDHAIKMGALFVHERINKIKINKKDSILLYFGKEKSKIEADAVIGAFGVNTAIIQEIPFNYRPPKTWITCQAEIPLSNDSEKERLGNMINVFFTKGFGIKFIALTPKEHYITITAIGKDVKINDLISEIKNSEVNNYLPPDWEICCYCHPQMPVTSPSHPYTDRCIIIGDASYSRYLKNGIGSAFCTAKLAAETIMSVGVSESAIEGYYNKKCKQIFQLDNYAGKFLFFLHDLISTNMVQSHAYLELVKSEQEYPPNKKKKLSEILWHLYTGDKSYIEVLRDTIDIGLQTRLTIKTIKKIKKGIL